MKLDYNNVDFTQLIRIQPYVSKRKMASVLRRIGVMQKYADNDNRFHQVNYYFSFRGKYYIAHYKELCGFLGTESRMRNFDLARRNRVAQVMEGHGLVRIINKDDLLNHHGFFINKKEQHKYKITILHPTNKTIVREHKFHFDYFLMELKKLNTASSLAEYDALPSE